MYGKYSGSTKGTVTSIDSNGNGLLTSTDGHKFEFAGASADIQKGSHVIFSVRFCPDWRNGIAKNVELDPNPPAAPEFVVLVQGCKNVEARS